MQDGYVKEPAVATRANFNPKSMSKDALELLKLEDGVRIHESAKVDLDVYAQQSGERQVKPFILVIAENTDHANELVQLIEGDPFFDRRYKGRVIQGIGTDVDEKPKQAVVVDPNFETALGITQPMTEITPGPTAPSVGVQREAPAPARQPKYTKPEEVAAAKATIEAIAKVMRDPQMAPSPKALQSDEVQKKLVEAVKDRLSSGQLMLYPDQSKLTEDQLVWVVREATAVYNALTSAIPRVIVLPKGVVRAGFRDFSLDLSSLRLPPVSQEILVRHLESGSEHVIGALTGGAAEERLENYVVRGLIDFDDVSYDEQADLLYKLAARSWRTCGRTSRTMTRFATSSSSTRSGSPTSFTRRCNPTRGRRRRPTRLW